MPLTAGGKLSLVASADIGALGSKEGAPVIYDWVLPGIAPLLLPWLAILALLALKPNRFADAWLIWLPLGCLIGLTLALPPIVPSGTEFFLDVVSALAAGWGAVWLLSSYLRRQHRFVTFLCVLAALAGFSVLAFVSQQSLNLTGETLVAGIALLVSALVSAAAFSLAGLSCRNRYRPAGLFVWLLLLLAVIWLAVMAPFFLIAMISSNGAIEWSEFFGPVLAVAAVNFAMLLPFLILSSASPFFRERLKVLLHVKTAAPAVVAPLPEASLKT